MIVTILDIDINSKGTKLKSRTFRIFILLVVNIALMIFLLYERLIHSEYLPQSEIERIFDSHMQSSINSKPFIYKITSFEEVAESTLEGKVWCVIIDPPLESYAGRSKTIHINHFVIALQDPDWNVFGLTETKKVDWTDIGCTNW